MAYRRQMAITRGVGRTVAQLTAVGRDHHLSPQSPLRQPVGEHLHHHVQLRVPHHPGGQHSHHRDLLKPSQLDDQVRHLLPVVPHLVSADDGLVLRLARLGHHLLHPVLTVRADQDSEGSLRGAVSLPDEVSLLPGPAGQQRSCPGWPPLQAGAGLLPLLHLPGAPHEPHQGAGGAGGRLQGAGQLAAGLQCCHPPRVMDGQLVQVVHGGHREDPHLDHSEPGQVAGG